MPFAGQDYMLESIPVIIIIMIICILEVQILNKNLREI